MKGIKNKKEVQLAFIDCKHSAYGGQHALAERCAYLEGKQICYEVLHPFRDSGLIDLFREKHLTHRFAKLPPGFLPGKIGRILRIQLYLIKHNPAIVHADSFDSAYIACLLKKVNMITSKIVFTIRSDRYHFFNWADRTLLREADVLITNSDYSRRCIQKSLAREVRVHYSPIDFSSLEERAKRLPARVPYQQKKPTICYVGALEPRKNLSFFVDVANRLVEKKDITFYVYGDAKSKESKIYLEDVKRKISAAAVSRIIFKGYRPISEAISEADILLCPYLREPLGRVVPEFLYMGKQVVVSDSGGLVEAGAGWALSYDGTSIDACITALEKAQARMQNQIDLQSIRTALEKRYSPKSCVELDHNVYKSIDLASRN